MDSGPRCERTNGKRGLPVSDIPVFLELSEERPSAPRDIVEFENPAKQFPSERCHRKVACHLNTAVILGALACDCLAQGSQAVLDNLLLDQDQSSVYVKF